LTQLAALGSQDQYLSVAGEITFFKGVYRRHTNFAKESVFMQFNQTANWGTQSTCVISRTGDLLSKVWLNVKLNALNTALDEKDFVTFKKHQLGPSYPLKDVNGVPLKATGSPNYCSEWSYEINTSEYYPMQLKTGTWVPGYIKKDDFSGNPFTNVKTDATSTAAKNNLSGTDIANWTYATVDSDDSDKIHFTRNEYAAGRTLTVDEVRELLINPILAKPEYSGKTKAFTQDLGWLDADTFNHDVDLQREFVEKNPGKNPKARYCDEVGHALIDKVDLVIGGTLIDSHPGHYLQVWNELTQTPEKKQIAHLIGRSGNEAELEALAMTEQNLFIPLQFFFCRHLMCSLPLIALQYHQVEIKVTFSPLERCIGFPGYEIGPLVDTNKFDIGNESHLYSDSSTKASMAATYNLGPHASFFEHHQINSTFIKLRPKSSLNRDSFKIVEGRLMCNLVYLEEEERKTFAGSTHEYLVDLLQYQGPQSATKTQTVYHAYFNHPTSELIWTFVPKASIEGGEPFNYTALQSSYNAAGDTLKTAKLQFNGYDRFQDMEAEYFREIIPAQYHTSVPTRPIYVYSFALEPEDFRPSGSVNLSRIDNVKLICNHVDFEPTIRTLKTGDDSRAFYGGDYDRHRHVPEYSGYKSVPGSYSTTGERFTNMAISHDPQLTGTVAVHPTTQGEGLFLQTTDGWSTAPSKGAELRVYARSKNVLRIKSGMAGLAYAN
jgi:hypothetical protein